MKKLLLVALSLLSMHGLAALESDAPIAVDKAGVALDGYDMVAYFEGNRAKGSSQFSSHYRGATWYFVSAGNKAKFDADSEKYMPEFGGYCAYAISKERTAKGSGKYGNLTNGKLFFSADFITQKRYNRNKESYNKKAEENWSEVKNAIKSGK